MGSKIHRVIHNYKHMSPLLAYRPPPCSNGPAFIFLCHTLRPSVMHCVVLFSFMYHSLMMLSSHLFLGALLLFHGTYIVIIFLVAFSPSFLSIWPYHLSRIFLRKVVIGSMLASHRMSSFLMWSFLSCRYPFQNSHLSGVEFLGI